MLRQLRYALIFVLVGITGHVLGKTETIIYTVSSITISGNKITNERIILRELTFSIGDTIIQSDISLNEKRSKENLDKTLLFNFVTITFLSNNGSLSVYIDVEERWYLWPFPIFEYVDRNLSSFIKEGNYQRINYGGYVRFDNVRGMGDQISIRFVTGYRKQIGLNYSTQSLDRLKQHGILARVSYQTNHEIPFASINNKPVYFNTHNGKARWTFFGEISYQFRPKHNWYHIFSVGTLLGGINDTIAKLNPNYYGSNRTSFAVNHLSYEITLDKRNSKIFPLSGYVGKFEIARQGIFPSESVNLWHVKLSGGQYANLYRRFYSGIDLMVKQSSKSNLPYFLNEAIGFNDYIRGYEYYVTNGSAFAINKNSLKFELLSNKVINLPLIPNGKFKKTNLSIYWSVFTDTGFVKPDKFTPNDNLEGKFLYGYGSGLYLFAYYDIVFRVEYSVNIFGESGIFLHFGTPFLNN